MVSFGTLLPFFCRNFNALKIGKVFLRQESREFLTFWREKAFIYKANHPPPCHRLVSSIGRSCAVDKMEVSAVESPSPGQVSNGLVAKPSKKQPGGPGTSKVRSKRSGAKIAKTHPSYSQMIKEAITALKDRKGSSRVAILKYISSRYQLGDNGKRVHSQLRLAIKKGIASGNFMVAKGAGVNGSFRLGAKVPAKTKEKSHEQKKTVSEKKKKSDKVVSGPRKPRMKKATTAKKSPKRKKKASKPKPKVSKPKKTAL